MLSNNLMGGPVKKESVVQQVINKITDAIMLGNIKPGDQLPTEMELIEMFDVSRNSLRSALQTLRAYGVIEVRRPEGTFVCDKFTPQMLNPMLYSILLQNEAATKDVIALRQVIDSGVSQLILHNGLSQEDEKLLEEKYDSLIEAVMEENYDCREIVRRDIELHTQMAMCTHNSMIVMLNEFLQNLTTESRIRTVQKIYEKNDREYMVKAHRLHLDALERKPGSNLEQALDFSYYYWKSSFNL